MNTLKIMDAIKTIIKSLDLEGVSIHQNHASNKAKYPYVVFRLEDTVDTSPSYNHILKFMIYDHRNKSSKGNAMIADLIQNAFNKKQYFINDLGLHSLLSIRQVIPSEFLVDSQVVELQFDLRTYGKED